MLLEVQDAGALDGRLVDLLAQWVTQTLTGYGPTPRCGHRLDSALFCGYFWITKQSPKPNRGSKKRWVESASGALDGRLVDLWLSG